MPVIHAAVALNPAILNNVEMTTEATMQTANVEGRVCKNCEAELSGRYCARCGQADKAIDPSLHDLLHELTHEFLHLDGKIFATLRDLVIRPGRLSAEFLSGHRARYIAPVRLYLTLSVLFFFAVMYSSQHVKTVGTQEKDNVALELNVNGKQVANVKASPEDKAEIGALANDKSRIAQVITKALKDPEAFRHSLITNVSRVMFVIVPLFALGLRIAYRNRNRRYPSFVYFSLHYHSFVFLVLTLYFLAGFTHVSALETIAGWAVVIWVPVYLLVAMRRVFGGSWRNTLLRMLALGAFYFPCLVLGMIAAGAIALFTL